jgi:hypothetical protein
MSGNNLENLLLGGDDSSSGDESDTATGRPSTATVALIPPKPQSGPPQIQMVPTAGSVQRLPQQQLPPPAHPSQPPQPQQLPPAAQKQPSEMTMRLKQMYAPASVNQGMPPGVATPSSSYPNNSAVGQQPGLPVKQQQAQQRAPTQPTQQQHPPASHHRSCSYHYYHRL